MSTILDVRQLSGGYVAAQPVIDDVSFKVNQHEIVALIGLNGAGKSTTIKHILGLLQPTNGEITINGLHFSTDPERYRSQYAYIPEMPTYYDELTLWEHLTFVAQVYGLEQSQFEERAEHLLQEFRMDKFKHRFPFQFSKGMKQKLMIMMAFLIRPSLYIIDEPILGLDPLGIQSLLEWLADSKREGAGVLMSTHILSTAEKYCDRFIVMHDGKVKVQGSLDELRAFSGMEQATLDEIYMRLTVGDAE